MTGFFFVIIALGIYDLWAMRKRNMKKEIIIYSVLSVMVAAIGFYYYQDPLSRSFAGLLLNLLGFKE
ncbi:MAG: hypothetical protein BWY15_00794 [Firmicutes bacterium ADurb.Bin193]|nr:MAG: hypothetical protein BWY15_00794 [Firmicutes bacterium ADurb.Bin193]